MPGIGPAARVALAAEGVTTVADLLLRLPVGCQDRSTITPVAALQEVAIPVLVRVRVVRVRARSAARRRLRLVEAEVADDSGEATVVWFNNPWVAGSLVVGEERMLYGRVRSRPGTLAPQLVNPEVDAVDGARRGLVPVYRRAGSLAGRRLARVMEACRKAAPLLLDPLPDDVRRLLGLPELSVALRVLHGEEFEGAPAPRAARQRLALDELLAHACRIEAVRRARRSERTCPVQTGTDPVALMRRILPFEPTGAQRRTVIEITADLARDRPMARLLEGDVGAGKTAVAATVMALVANAGGQVALMVPTELLAEQHHRTLADLLSAVGIAPLLLTGSTSAADRQTVLAELAGDAPRVVVGTHALFQEGVRFARLRLVVIDEQHRFGVAQRRALLTKGRHPHQLVMTATPIPRSLAMTVYGDLDLSVIDELPPGRQPVRTVVRVREPSPRLDRFLGDELADGGRVYIVYPRIDAGADDSGAPALLDDLATVRSRFGDAAVGVIHGRMGCEERDAVSAAFRAGSVQLLLATSVIEVGLDVPEASVIVVEGADHFGLAQLHQLRGRVGRGSRPSWCVLRVGSMVGTAARRRLRALCRLHDGFAVAEADLALRGPGDVAGQLQSGRLELRFADLVRDRPRLAAARAVAIRLADDGRLTEVAAALSALHPAAVADAPAAERA